MMMPPSDSIDDLCVNTIRTLCIDAVQQANSGHPGTPMAMAPVGAVVGACLDITLLNAASDRRHLGR
jgi:transketolase